MSELGKTGDRDLEICVSVLPLFRDPGLEFWMHLPKYFNPHLTHGTTRIVSRKTLWLEDGAGAGAEGGGDVGGVELDGQEVEDLHMMLDKIVSKRLKLKRAFEPSDGPHSSKRRKTLTEEGTSIEPQQPSEPVGEFTSSCSPRTSHRLSP